MEASTDNNNFSDAFHLSAPSLLSFWADSHKRSNSSSPSRYGVLSDLSVVWTPISTLLEYYKVLSPRFLLHSHEAESLVGSDQDQFCNFRSLDNGDDLVRRNDGYVAVRMMGDGVEELEREAASEVNDVSDKLGDPGNWYRGESTEGGGNSRDIYER